MWLLETSAYNKLRLAKLSGVTLTAEQQKEYNSMVLNHGIAGESKIMSVDGSTATIDIQGVLTKSPDFMSMLFGGGNTTYKDIDAAILLAENNDRIDNVVFMIDSPGGSVDGLFDTISAMQHMKKKKSAVISGLAASAAYALASQAGNMQATSKATRLGSIGIRADIDVDDDTVIITSTDAPKKAPDVKTPEGVAMVREELDALHEIFIESIAAGRGVDTETVNASFGRGGTLLANEALKRGMIDSIADTPLSSVMNTNTKSAESSGAKFKVKSMDLTQLKADHPATYAAAVASGVEDGVKLERDRIGAHLIMGESSGDMKTAIGACKDGAEMNATIQATYLSAGMNRNDTQAREEDDSSAGAAGDNVNAENASASNAEKDAIEIAKGVAAMAGLTEVSL